jgi:hypothetical protein
MLTERLLDRPPVWLLYAGTALLLFAASEIGSSACGPQSGTASRRRSC